MSKASPDWAAGTPMKTMTVREALDFFEGLTLSERDAAIADKLGFDEPTNFSKFFRREADDSPAEFRRRQRMLL